MTRRLTADEAARVVAAAEPLPADPTPSQPLLVAELIGDDVAGSPISVAIVAPTVVVFASTTCDGCADLASFVAAGCDGFDVLGAMRSPGGPLPDPAVDAFVTGGRWVLGDQPFEALRVTAAPFFTVLDRTGVVVHEGVAFGRAHVAEQCEAARTGRARLDVVRLPRET